MTASENQTGIEVRRDGPVLHILLDRPAKKNAITSAMYTALSEALRDAEQDDAIRAVLISGNGGCFTAGNDLKDFAASPPTLENAPTVAFLKTLVAFRKILIAAVRGPAIGIGTTLLLHCDMVLATANARFQLPFVDLALVPEAGSSLLLPRLVGYQRAAEILLLGEPFDAERAHTLGLVNRIVEDDALDEAALDIARRIAAKPAAAVRATKRLLKSDGQDVAARMEEEIKIFWTQLQSPELRAAIAAFFQTRT
jgi:enoyl-CoA hydratase/carnithine racemase